MAGETVDILALTDCMTIGPEYLSDDKKYPGLVKDFLKSKTNSDVSVEIIAGSGETTFEAYNKARKIVESGKKYDLTILAYGINDALPRGLKRETRSKIIRMMYKIKLNESLRLAARTYFLNPLEFTMQFIRRPLHYNSVQVFLANILGTIELLKKVTSGKIIFISINPVLNYRFVKGNNHIKRYNESVINALKENGIEYVDVFSLFFNEELLKYLAKDKFHYSEQGHRLIAESIIALLERKYAI